MTLGEAELDLFAGLPLPEAAGQSLAGAEGREGDPASLPPPSAPDSDVSSSRPALHRQLVFDLALPPALGRDDLLPAPANAEALAMLDPAATWPMGRLLLIGPEGAGKSHLAAIWAHEAGAAIHPASSLRADHVDALVPETGALVIEDADCTAGIIEAETALFHLANLCTARSARLLLTARVPVRDWGLGLPDLQSRMEAVTALRLGRPDEALLEAVLVKLFADRQLMPAPGVLSALVRRMDRDLGLARRLAAAIDADALARGRAVTRPLALAVLKRLMDEG